MTCKRCHHDTARKFGAYGKRHIQRYRCSDCKATFSEVAPKIGTHYTSPETASKALAMMLEGMSVRAISRLTGLHIYCTPPAGSGMLRVSHATALRISRY